MPHPRGVSTSEPCYKRGSATGAGAALTENTNSGSLTLRPGKMHRPYPARGRSAPYGEAVGSHTTSGLHRRNASTRLAKPKLITGSVGLASARWALRHRHRALREYFGE